MRRRDLLREVWADLTSGTARAGIFALVLAVLTLALTAADVTSVVHDVTLNHTIDRAGGTTMVISATQGIDPQQCDALSATDPTLDSGALRSRSDEQLAALPDARIPVKEITPGMRALLSSEAPQAGVYVGGELATMLGITETGLRSDTAPSLTLSTQALPIAGIIPWPDDGRTPGLAYAVLSPTQAQGAFDECWLRAWPPRPDADSLLRTTVLTGSTAPDKATVQPLNTRVGTASTQVQRYAQRITRFASPLVALLCLVTGWAYVWMRRVEFSSDLTVGLSRADLARKVAYEMAAWALPTLAGLSGLSAWVLVSVPAEDASQILGLILTAGACMCSGLMLGATLALLRVKQSDFLDYLRRR